jgi:opacity protein-like surface antigen
MKCTALDPEEDVYGLNAHGESPHLVGGMTSGGQMRSALSVALAALAASSIMTAFAAADEPAAADRFYVETLLGGPLPLKQEFKSESLGDNNYYDPEDGIGGWLSLGVHLTPRLRAQFDGSWIRAFDGKKSIGGFEFDYDGKDDLYVLMASLYYSLDKVGPFTPYVGAGFGMARYDITENGGPFVTDHQDSALALAGHVGFDYPLTERMTWTSRYTLGWIGEAKFPTVLGDDIVKESDFEHMFLTGLRFDFR